MKSVYKKYMERLIEISGRSRSIYLKSITKKYTYDIGRLLEDSSSLSEEFSDYLWQRTKKPFKLLCEENAKHIVKKIKSAEKGDVKDAAILLQHEFDSVNYLKREIEEIEKETGKYELFIGYPFIRGYINKDTAVRAPLFLFPAKINIDNKNVEIELNHSEPVQLNKALILAYTKEYGLKTDALIQDFEDMSDERVNSPAHAAAYLKSFGFKLKTTKKQDFIEFEQKDMSFGDQLEIVNFCVLGRFPLANAIYNDYAVLERQNQTTPAIDALLSSKTIRSAKAKPEGLYLINRLDYSQENAIQKINEGSNMVLYGPPGTGKSQTIVNVVSDALCKGKKVLVVSQKRAALDVVYNRLGALNKKAMLLLDADKNKADFYKAAYAAHNSTEGRTPNYETLKFEASVNNLNEEIKQLEEISDLLFKPTEFGISLQQMYAQSYSIGKDSLDYKIYQRMLDNKKLLKMDFNRISGTMRVIREKNKGALYSDFIEAKKANPLITHLKPDLDVHLLNEAKTFIEKSIAKTILPFDSAAYPHSRYILTYYLEHNENNRYALKQYSKLVAKLDNPALSKLHTLACIPPFWPLLLYTAPKMTKSRRKILRDFDLSISALRSYVEEYALMHRVLDDAGFAMTLDAIANGNNAYLKKLLAALEDYDTIVRQQVIINSLTEDEQTLLDFAYGMNQSKKPFLEILGRLVSVRVYHEVCLEEMEKKNGLSKLLVFNDLRERVLSLKKEQRHIVREMAFEKSTLEYIQLIASDPENTKNLVHQLSKPRAQWPIRRTLEYFDKFLLALFPCWLLSPETVSTIMPLKKEMFDLILFDEASQVFIESTLPTIFRGKNIVVAGDNKQLRPTASFVKRFLGSEEFSADTPLAQQAALEVESLLDLATSRYNPTNLTYHYRSRYEELINFSNYAFYGGKLQIAPNTEKKMAKPPIERIMVKGQWAGRHNHEEAEEVVDLVKKILRNRKDNETVGIVTFNMEQKEYIEDLLDKECLKNASFKKLYYAEKMRVEHGEDLSIFVKNLENVQGDERDIIIFSIGYARNENDKVFTHFGSLSVEGGENRLNVAITRAKRKVYVVTSVEPEELSVDNSKNIGPKLLKKYLQYARAVSLNDTKQIKNILSSLCAKEDTSENLGAFETQLKAELIKLGYKVDTLLGNADYKISLGVYDEETGRYILGIECDYAAFQSSLSVLERDVYRPKFLESRGWVIMRVWSRDWWMNKNKVIAGIERAVKYQKKLAAQRAAAAEAAATAEAAAAVATGAAAKKA